MASKSARKPAPVTSYTAPSRDPHSTPVANRMGDGTSLNYHTNINFWRGRVLSFGAALQGVAYVVRTQPNVWIELAALAVVMGAGVWFGISAVEWAVLGLTVALILALEAVNTAVETVIDLVSPQLHPLAKIAKDTAAGALIIAVVGSIFVAAMIFVPRLWALLG
jgi:diacylglycerol kinase